MDFIPDYMQKILRNLLINAVKFTSQGGKILITVTANKGQVAITIADSGMGISQEDLPYIFRTLLPREQSRSTSRHGHRVVDGAPDDRGDGRYNRSIQY